MLLQRFVASYALLFLGIEFIFWNMKWNGSAKTVNPAWRLVHNIHSGLWTVNAGAVIGLLLIFVFCFFAAESDSARTQQKDIKPPDPSPVTPEVLAEQRRAEEEARRELDETRRQEELLKQRAEIEKRKHLEEQRRRMSSEDVNRSALEDFL